MSGICGIWNLDDDPVDSALLRRMSQTMAHRGSDGEGVHLGGAVGMACRNFHVTAESLGKLQPVVHRSGAVLAFDGRLDNRSELLAHPGVRNEVAPGASDAEIALTMFMVAGGDFLVRLSGDFALAVFDPASRRLTLARDPIGTRPLYYTRSASGSLIFGSEIKALLGHPSIRARPDEAILASILLGTGIESEDPAATLFDGITRVLPGHAVDVSASGLHIRRYWDFDPELRTRFASFPEYAEAFRHHLREAVRRRTRSAFPVAVSVSGGLDSSSIYCLAETLRERSELECPTVRGVSYTWSDGSASDETAFIRDIERMYQVAILREPLRPVHSVEHSRNSVWHTEDMMLDHLADCGEFNRFVKQSGARVLLTGHWGDQVLNGRAYWLDLFRTFSWGTLHVHMREYRRWMEDANIELINGRAFIRDLIRHHVPAAWIPFLRRMRTRFTSSKREKNQTMYSETLRVRAQRQKPEPKRKERPFHSEYSASLYDQVRSPFHVRCMEWNNKVGAMSGLEMDFPMLDRELVAYLLSIPGDVPSFGGVSRALLRTAMLGVIPESISLRRTKGDFTDMGNQATAKALPALMDYIHEQSRVVEFGYIDADALDEGFTRCAAGLQDQCDNSASRRINSLFGLELWLRIFFDGNQACQPEADLLGIARISS